MCLRSRKEISNVSGLWRYFPQPKYKNLSIFHLHNNIPSRNCQNEWAGGLLYLTPLSPPEDGWLRVPSCFTLESHCSSQCSYLITRLYNKLWRLWKKKTSLKKNNYTTVRRLKLAYVKAMIWLLTLNGVYYSIQVSSTWRDRTKTHQPLAVTASSALKLPLLLLNSDCTPFDYY